MLFHNWNWWCIVAPAMMLGMLILGWFTVGMKGCRKRERTILEVMLLIYAVLSAMVFGALLLLESYCGIVQVGLSTVAPGESEAYADIFAFVAIGGSAFVYFAFQIGLGILSNVLKNLWLDRVGSLKRRCFCRVSNPDKAALACPYAFDVDCPCGIDRRLRLNIPKADFARLVKGVEPLFDKQREADRLAECTITLPVVDGKVYLSEAQIVELQLQAYELSKELPEQAELCIKRAYVDLFCDSMRTVLRRTQANVFAMLGKRVA